ncbi:hypothetical protein B7C62_15335 [Kitasatospora albolonga]|uniref:RDD domain-containing protein n=1 Tax=Kitasatospora albolonga TaxID=68173 RepID=A0ABC8BTQ9_9ACTN|nr:hypothetical protein B7C62_15335 [Kitasatospora albolonga]
MFTFFVRILASSLPVSDSFTRTCLFATLVYLVLLDVYQEHGPQAVAPESGACAAWATGMEPNRIAPVSATVTAPASLGFATMRLVLTMFSFAVDSEATAPWRSTATGHLVLIDRHGKAQQKERSTHKGG